MDVSSMQPGSFPQTREEFVAGRLRDAILRGDLAPGTRLDEGALAKALGVSRTPVRVALRILAAESLVELQPHRGTVVSELSVNELSDVYFVRMVLEGTAVRLAAAKMTDDRIVTLESILAEMDRTEDPDQWMRLNNHFHSTIYRAASGPRMLFIIEYVRNISTPYIRVFIESAEHKASSAQEHRRILDACKARDADAAEAETRKHLEAVARASAGVIMSAGRGGWERTQTLPGT